MVGEEWNQAFFVSNEENVEGGGGGLQFSVSYNWS